MTPEERAGLLRITAGLHEVMAGRYRLAAAAVRATESFRRLDETITIGESREVATHPDLAELNVQMNALYDWPDV